MKLIFLSVCLILTNGAHLPPEIKACSKSNPNFIQCVSKSAEEAIGFLANGYKPFGVNPIEPLLIESQEIKGNTGGAVSLEQKFMNIKLHGLSKLTVTKLKIDLDKCFFYIETKQPTLRIESDYEFKGQILIFPINGNGLSNITLSDLSTISQLQCERFQKKGKTYIRLTDYNINLNTENVFLQFDNIVNGNPELSAEILKTINENSVTVFKEIKKDHEEAYGQVFKQIANKIFTKVPENEIFLD